MSHFFPSNFLCIRCFFYTFLCNKLQCEFCAFNEKNLISYIICTLSKLITNEFLSVLFFFSCLFMDCQWCWFATHRNTRYVSAIGKFTGDGNVNNWNLITVILVTQSRFLLLRCIYLVHLYHFYTIACRNCTRDAIINMRRYRLFMLVSPYTLILTINSFNVRTN